MMQSNPAANTSHNTQRSGNRHTHQRQPARCPASWPHARQSYSLHSVGIDWHVQQFSLADDKRPIVFLLHGTGASTHSWRDVIPHLTDNYQVVACDLPGHGYTTRPRNSAMSLNGMGRLITGLLNDIDIAPDYLVGHSAGAALCCQLALEQKVTARCIVSINGALMPFDGLAGQFFAPMANLLAVNPVVPRLVSWRAKHSNLVQKLIKDTGSTLDATGLECYSQLLRRKEHISGALSMMANWDLVPLWRRLPGLNIPLHCVVGTGDRTVSPKQSDKICEQLGSTQVHKLPTLGHLAHEEAPEKVAALLEKLFQRSANSTDNAITNAAEQAGLDSSAGSSDSNNFHHQDSADNRRHPA